MPRRRLQFSLLGLLLFMTLCSAGLAWWFSRPEHFFQDSVAAHGIVYAAEPHDLREVARLVQQQYLIWTPRGKRTARITFALVYPADILADAGLNLHALPFEHDQELWQQVLEVAVSEVQGTKLLQRVKFRVILDIRQHTATLTEQVSPRPPSVEQSVPLTVAEEALLIIQLDEQWQPHLLLDDGKLELPGLPPKVLQDIRQAHEAF